MTSPAARGRRPGTPLGRALFVAGLLAAALLSAAVLTLGVLTLFPAGTNLATMLAPYTWVVVGPHLVVVGGLALLLGVLALFRGRRRLGAVVTVLAVAATGW